MRAVVYDAAEAGAEVCNWLEPGVPAHHGNFRIELGGAGGSGSCYGLAAMLRGQGDLWLEMSLQRGSGAFETLTPRLALGATARVHHAQVARQASGALAAAVIPAGAVTLFETDCPEGWERVADFDGRFPRGAAAAGGTGGGPNTGSAGAAHDHPGTNSAGGHGHGIHAGGHHGHGVNCASALGAALWCSSWGGGCGWERVSGTDAGGSHAHSTSSDGAHGHSIGSADGPHEHPFEPPFAEFVFCRKL